MSVVVELLMKVLFHLVYLVQLFLIAQRENWIGYELINCPMQGIKRNNWKNQIGSSHLCLDAQILSSCGKVMFSQAWFKNSVHRGARLPPGHVPHPWAYMPPRHTAHPHPLLDAVNERTVRILLECILVKIIFVPFVWWNFKLFLADERYYYG